MKRIIRGLLAAAILASVAGVFASPAGADTLVCVGQGSATTPPLVYPTVGGTVGVPLTLWVRGANTGPFSLSIGTGVCQFVAPITGTLTGWCGRSTGTGTADGHFFRYESFGSLLVVSGEVVGVANAVPDVTTTPPQSCLTGATQFRVTGAVLTQHVVTTPVTTPVPSDNVTITVP